MLMDQTNRRPNRLADQKSPYLLQHAYNPVRWHPWGPDAFDEARRQDKPVFLSIGYSTCHWCHVMAHESFENEAIAEMMNEVFIPIKVDREERPDLDSLYMQVCQTMTGGGGWPLTIVMTPDKRPFFAGTYFPKDSRPGLVGMRELIPRIHELWRSQREDVEKSAERVTKALRQPGRSREGELDEGDLEAAYLQLRQRFDDLNGGFGTAPKFPTPHNVIFLLRYWERTGEKHALHMAEKTLRAMRRGGIFDQLGFGFHRYSTDSAWLVPHFEKMLYDQALLASAYLEAYQATGKAEYARTAREVFEYVMRDMTSPEGAFYSAEDADSEGEEGKYYLWTSDELKSCLRDDEYQLAARAFGVTSSGNFEGRNILHLVRTPAEIVGPPGSEDGAARRVEGIRRRLLDERSSRVRPDRDDKVLADWNALMISALARGSRALNDPTYLRAARRAARFLITRMRRKNGRLYHRYRDGDAAIEGLLDDYAFLLVAMLDLYEASFQTDYLHLARQLSDEMVAHFWDEDGDAFLLTPDDGEELLSRQRPAYDGAIPSGNSMAMLGLLRLGRMLSEKELEAKAERIGRSFAAEVVSSPSGFTQMLVAVDFSLGPRFEVVLVGNPGEEETKELVAAVNRPYVPRKIVLLVPKAGQKADILEMAGYLRDYASLGGRATAFVCRDYSCRAPTTDPSEVEKHLMS